MNYGDIYQYLAERLQPAKLTKSSHPTPSSSQENSESEQEFEPIRCETFRELCDHYFGPQALEHTDEIEKTLATILAVVLSTSATGGQLALRVIGPPGSAKSTLAESVSAAKKMVYATSKFTGIISGWASIKRSKMTASQINGKTLFIKDADPIVQLPNLKQIESELRDALGDGVIRGDYRTGRSFEIYTLFTLIMCGTPVLRRMDDSELGARYLDISIHDKNTPTERIVSRAIDSQFSTICSQLAGGIKEVDSDIIRRKEIIRKLAPPTIGFLYYKREQIRQGFHVVPWSEPEKSEIHAMGNLISYLRARVDRGPTGERKNKADREIATRLGEQLTRLKIFLGVVLKEIGPRPIEIGNDESKVIRKVVRDSTEGFSQDIVRFLRQEKRGESKDVIAANLRLSSSATYNLLQDLRELGIVKTTETSNPHGNRGRKLTLYSLRPELQSICKAAQVEL